MKENIRIYVGVLQIIIYWILVFVPCFHKFYNLLNNLLCFSCNHHSSPRVNAELHSALAADQSVFLQPSDFFPSQANLCNLLRIQYINGGVAGLINTTDIVCKDRNPWTCPTSCSLNMNNRILSVACSKKLESF